MFRKDKFSNFITLACILFLFGEYKNAQCKYLLKSVECDMYKALLNNLGNEAEKNEEKKEK